MTQPSGATRAERKQATSRAVLEAAREEFEEVGFESANIRAIAERAGVSAGTVLHHHGDKRQLLHAALFDDLERTLARALGRIGDGPIEDQLHRLTRTLFRYYEKRPRLSRALLKESLFADEPWASRFAGQVSRVHDALSDLVRQAVDRGELRRDADEATFAIAYLSFYYFALIAWVQGAGTDPVGFVDAMARQHLAGLRPSDRNGKRRRP